MSSAFDGHAKAAMTCSPFGSENGAFVRGAKVVDIDSEHMSSCGLMADWIDLSDDELAARIRQHADAAGFGNLVEPDALQVLVARRDDPLVADAITALLNDEIDFDQADP